MDRKVPRSGSEEIELYLRTYYSLLRSTTEIQIRTLEEAHINMGSALHLHARGSTPDISALIYSSLRLPRCMPRIDRVILGQSREVFELRGIGSIENWELAESRARRRHIHFDGENTLAVYIASRSDIDDILPLLTAFQIEWNKLHRLLRGNQAPQTLAGEELDDSDVPQLASSIGVPTEDLRNLSLVWGSDFWPLMRQISMIRKRMTVRLLAGSLNDYRRATQLWWENVESSYPSILHRPVYFVSSNTHSLPNLLSGFALRHEREIMEFVETCDESDLVQEWQDIHSGAVPSSPENFLYYAFKRSRGSPVGRKLISESLDAEQAIGIHRVSSPHSFDVQAQIIEMSRLRADWADPRLPTDRMQELADSDAVIVNIDYPLGMAAYLILSHVATRVGELLGVYILGKAATLNGAVGDIMMPSVVFDEQSNNSYLFENCFQASDLVNDLVYGTVLDNQKAVSVRGTFLQTPRYMDVFYREGYTDIEMEAGPYLSAIYELARPKRYPNDEIVDIHSLPLELGIVHYASDTPLSEGGNLGAGSLSYFGMDPTYAASLAILRRIITSEANRQGQRGGQVERMVVKDSQ